MNFQNETQTNVFEDEANFEDSSEVSNENEDKVNANIFDTEKLDVAINMFLEKHPECKDHEIIDFIGRARRSYVRAKRKNLTDEQWLQKLEKHISTFKLVVPLQHELEKLMLNQKMVQMQIEQTKIIKEKAKLEKDKIDFLIEQNNLSKNGKSSIYPNLTTVDKLETIKKDIEKHYYDELNKIKLEQSGNMQNVINSEVSRLHSEFDSRYKQWSQFYEMFKQKYINLQNFSIQMREELNTKNNESYDLKLRINQLINGLKHQESQIDFLKSEIEKRNKAIDYFRANQPSIIRENVEHQLDERLKEQNNAVNLILLEKEKNLLANFEDRRNKIESEYESRRNRIESDFETRRNQIELEFETRRNQIELDFKNKQDEMEKLFAEKQKEHDLIKENAKELEKLWSIDNVKLKEFENKNDELTIRNKSLTKSVEALKNQNNDLMQMITKLRSENLDLSKLNNLLVKKYNDSQFFESTNEKLTVDMSKLIENQKKLLNLLNNNKPITSNEQVNLIQNEFIQKTYNSNNKLEEIKSLNEFIVPEDDRNNLKTNYLNKQIFEQTNQPNELKDSVEKTQVDKLDNRVSNNNNNNNDDDSSSSSNVSLNEDFSKIKENDNFIDFELNQNNETNDEETNDEYNLNENYDDDKTYFEVDKEVDYKPMVDDIEDDLSNQDDPDLSIDKLMNIE
ncbi:coiled-coil domain-containing protein [Mycoplasmoides alvi]|uniref:hypothetical protein n=1 Tax=Mycoplasmoides alvi TaxID=78580 RepID=UPI00051B817E|nr:hypothetical protein [Mycoplasmoides alvi]